MGSDDQARFLGLPVEFRGEFDEMRFQKENLCHQAAFYDRRLFEIFGSFKEQYKIFAD